MPLREGGLGLTSAQQAAAPAYVGGWARTASFLARAEVVRACKLPANLRAAALCRSLANGAHTHCQSLQAAWGRVDAQLQPGTDDDEPITAVLDISGILELHSAPADAQKQLARRLASLSAFLRLVCGSRE